VRGLRARGGFEVDVAWRDGVLQSAELRAVAGGEGVVRYGEKTRAVKLRAGERVTLSKAQFG
jgi:alpha-L-fucosidase 2